MGLASSGQEEAEGWGVLALSKGRWEGDLCLGRSRGGGKGPAHTEEEDVEG